MFTLVPVSRRSSATGPPNFATPARRPSLISRFSLVRGGLGRKTPSARRRARERTRPLCELLWLKLSARARALVRSWGARNCGLTSFDALSAALVACVAALVAHVAALVAQVATMVAHVAALVAQVRALVAQGAAKVAQVEALVAQVGALVMQGGALVAQIGALVAQGAALVAPGCLSADRKLQVVTCCSKVISSDTIFGIGKVDENGGHAFLPP